MNLASRLKYIFGATVRRKTLDNLLGDCLEYFEGDLVVLDIGGRDRGNFKKPKESVKKWIFADVNSSHDPDVVLNVADMSAIKNNFVDIVLATELFEHVSKPEKGIGECFRVLKKKGVFIISAPFLYRIHNDPDDFQRWTDEKWRRELRKTGFKVERFEVMGRFFSVMADNFRFFVQSLPRLLRYIIYPLVLVSDLVSLLDKTNFVLENNLLSSFHGGYFMIFRK